MELRDIIKTLSATAGPSGFEDAVREKVTELLTAYTDEITSDVMGNVIAIKRSKIEGAETLMLNAHIDEIGFIVTGHEKGFLRFSCIGGIDPRMLPAREIRILTDEPMYGVIDTLPPHVMEAADYEKSIETKNLFIDVGLSQEEAIEKIPLGTPCVFVGGCMELGEKMLCGKALDDRACTAIIIKAMEKISEMNLPVNVVCLFSAQEELGCRGAVTGAFSVNPQMSISLDVTHALTPDSKKHETMKMGEGVAIGIGPNMHRGFNEVILNTAKEYDINHQLEVISGRSGTDAWVIQVAREGIKTALLSIPTKYMHSPVETIHIEDCESAVKLIEATVLALGKED